jgi:hypothetical protein
MCNWAKVLGVPFHASRMQLSYLGDAQLTLDVRSGCLGTMSLEDADGLHFVLRSRKLSAAELADLFPRALRCMARGCRQSQPDVPQCSLISFC